MLKLVPCMAITRGQHCSAPPRHRLNHNSHIISWYCSPFLLQHLAALIEGLTWGLSLAQVYPAKKKQQTNKQTNKKQKQKAQNPPKEPQLVKILSTQVVTFHMTAMEYLCHKLPRICSTCRKHSPVLSSFMAYHRVCN